MQKLFAQPFKYWNNAIFTFKRHAGHGTSGEMGLHTCTFPILTSLLSQMSGQHNPLRLLLIQVLKKRLRRLGRN